MSRPIHVLLVDDNPEDRALVVRELRNAYPDARISEAIDQLQLEQQIERGTFDLVVTDFHLQWSNGIEVLKLVKARLRHCPVIMFTATGSEEIAVEAMKQGLDDYIIKNVKHLVRLRAAIQSVLEHSKTQQHAQELARRMESLLGQLQVGVFSCAVDGRFIELNRAMSGLLSDLGIALDSRLHDLFASVVDAEEFLQELRLTDLPKEYEIRREIASNEMKVLRLQARRIALDDAGYRIDGLLEDITKRKISEAESRQAAVAAAQISMLSPKENEVLQHVVEGRANKVIARRMDISEKTVEKHRSNLMKKLNRTNVAELVRLAIIAEKGDPTTLPKDSNL